MKLISSGACIFSTIYQKIGQLFFYIILLTINIKKNKYDCEHFCLKLIQNYL